MGILVPPSAKTALNFKVIALDEAQRCNWRLSWACLYCGSHHPADRLDCPNCGAPRTGPDMRVVADWLKHDLGVDIPL